MLRKLTINSNYLLLIIIGVSVILRFYHIDYQSVWLDEICSITEANPALKWSDLEATLLVSDPHPQLYFVLLKSFFLVFGNSTLVARILSAIIGVVGIYCFYLMSKEFASRKVGLIAALLLSVNYFHIYHSQEVRMYGLLFLFTTLSFYRFILFVRQKSIKNSIWYGVFTGLMLLTQFFGLFVLAAQIFILFVYFLKTEKNQKLQYFYKSLLAGGIMIALFLPSLNIFIETTKKKYEAIAPTTIDTILQIFKDFAQDSYLIIILSMLSMALYFIYFFKEKLNNDRKESQTLFILLSWIGITLLIPIVRSYLVSPMISSRYFITILPAILLLVAMGFNRVKNRMLQISLLAVFVFYSLFHLIFVTEYYNKTNKTQFREITQFVIKNNPQEDDVISNLSWYLLYFLNNDTVHIPVVQSGYEEYVVQMSKNPSLRKSFWFIGAFGNHLVLSDASQKYLNENFTITQSLNLYDSWTKQYTAKSETDVENEIISPNAITLSSLSDEYWDGGVSRVSNMFLVDNTLQNENKIKNASKIKFKNGETIPVVGYEKTGNYIQIFIKAAYAKDYLGVATYPNSIEMIKKNE